MVARYSVPNNKIIRWKEKSVCQITGKKSGNKCDSSGPQDSSSTFVETTLPHPVNTIEAQEEQYKGKTRPAHCRVKIECFKHGNRKT
jgi:hypothetical protein